MRVEKSNSEIEAFNDALSSENNNSLLIVKDIENPNYEISDNNKKDAA